MSPTVATEPTGTEFKIFACEQLELLELVSMMFSFENSLHPEHTQDLFTNPITTNINHKKKTPWSGSASDRRLWAK
jgi:hypothetical protein